MMRFNLISILIFLGVLAVADLASATNGCKHRSFGHESTVCVCNEEYCDSLEPITKVPAGILRTYSTSRDGKRFHREDIPFKHSTSEFDGNVIRLPLDQRNGVPIFGFGGALTDATGYNFYQLPQKLQQSLIRDYFSDHGIEYSSIRVTIGGSDMSQREYSDDDYNGDDFNLEHFKLQPEDLKYKIPFLNLAQKIAAHQSLKTFGTAWSAPAWMKTNHKLDHGGRIKGEPGGKYYRAFAKYLVKFLKQYQQHNVSWWGMTVVNEPGKFPYNSLEMSAEQQRDFIKKDLGPELHKQGLDKLKLMIYDWNIPGMKEFVDTVLSDPEAAKYVSGIAYHWYATNEKNRANLKQIHQKWPKKFIMATEACEYFKNDSLGAWHVAQHYAQDVIRSLKYNVTGWVDWNMILDTHGGPSWIGQHLDAPIIVNPNRREYYKQPAFYILGQFSKFLPPGSMVLPMEIAPTPQIDTISFVRPDGGNVFVLLNSGNQTRYFVFMSTEGMTIIGVEAQSILTAIFYF